MITTPCSPIRLLTTLMLLLVAAGLLPAQGGDPEDRHELIDPVVHGERAARALLDMKLGRARATADYDKLKQLAKAMRDGTITQAERDELQRLARQLGGNGFKDLSAADQER